MERQGIEAALPSRRCLSQCWHGVCQFKGTMCSLASTGKSLFTVENMCGMSICGQPSCRLQCSYAVFNSLWPPTATSFKVTENTHPVLLVPSTPMEMVPQFLWDLMNLYVPSPYGERKVGAWYCRAPQNNIDSRTVKAIQRQSP